METPLDQETASADALGERPADEPASISIALTRAEDDELRRLHWLSRMGALAARKVERLIELRLRDRRTEIREPREFEAEEALLLDPTTPSRGTDDLVEVRRELESLAHSRLDVPFDDFQRERYRELLAAERLLIERSKRNKDAGTTGSAG